MGQYLYDERTNYLSNSEQVSYTKPFENIKEFQLTLKSAILSPVIGLENFFIHSIKALTNIYECIADLMVLDFKNAKQDFSSIISHIGEAIYHIFASLMLSAALFSSIVTKSFYNAGNCLFSNNQSSKTDNDYIEPSAEGPIVTL